MRGGNTSCLLRWRLLSSQAAGSRFQNGRIEQSNAVESVRCRTISNSYYKMIMSLRTTKPREAAKPAVFCGDVCFRVEQQTAGFKMAHWRRVMQWSRAPDKAIKSIQTMISQKAKTMSGGHTLCFLRRRLLSSWAADGKIQHDVAKFVLWSKQSHMWNLKCTHAQQFKWWTTVGA